MSAMLKYFKLGSEYSAVFNTTHLIWHIKKQRIHEVHSSNTGKWTEATLADTFKKKEKYPRDSGMAQNITEKVTELITLDNQLISMVENGGFLCHLELLNPWYAL